MRDPSSATYNAAIVTIATRDTDTEPAPFARRILRETQRRGFDTAANTKSSSATAPPSAGPIAVRMCLRAFATSSAAGGVPRNHFSIPDSSPLLGVARYGMSFSSPKVIAAFATTMASATW